MSKVCETAFFAATKHGADIFVPKGAIFADDDPITVGRDAHFVSTNDTDTPGAVQLNTPDGTPGFPRVEDDGTVSLGPGTSLDPVLGCTVERVVREPVVAQQSGEQPADPSGDPSGDAGATPAPSPAPAPAKKAAAAPVKKAAAKRS